MNCQHSLSCSFDPVQFSKSQYQCWISLWEISTGSRRARDVPFIERSAWNLLIIYLRDLAVLKFTKPQNVIISRFCTSALSQDLLWMVHLPKQQFWKHIKSGEDMGNTFFSAICLMCLCLDVQNVWLDAQSFSLEHWQPECNTELCYKFRGQGARENNSCASTEGETSLNTGWFKGEMQMH